MKGTRSPVTGCSLFMSLLFIGPTASAQAAPPGEAACTRLVSVVLPNTTITSAHVVAAGTFAPPAAAAGGGGASGRGLPPMPAVPGRVTGASAGLGLGYNGGRPIPQFRELPAFC